MTVTIKNSHVDLHTGRRTDTIVGNGQRIDVFQGFTPEQTAAIREYERTMHEETIPEIERVMRRRARDAQWSKQQIIY
jgi:hypothetical protein